MSPEDVVNAALDQIRVGATVTSINPSDGTYPGDVASRQYQPRIDALFRAVHWNCARFQSPLQILNAYAGTIYNPSGSLPNPPNGWLYEYSFPTTPFCLKVRYIFPWWGPANTTGNVSLPSTPLTTGNIPFVPNSNSCPVSPAPFSVSTDLDAEGNQIRVILCNIPYAQAVYTARVLDPTLWDPGFVDGATMTLAAWLAQPLSGDKQLAAGAATLAKQTILEARVSDGNEGLTTSDVVPDWIRARWRGGGMGAGDGYFAPWDSISIPYVGII